MAHEELSRKSVSSSLRPLRLGEKFFSRSASKFRRVRTAHHARGLAAGWNAPIRRTFQALRVSPRFMSNCLEKSVTFSLRPLRLGEKFFSRSASKTAKGFHLLRVYQRLMRNCLESQSAPLCALCALARNSWYVAIRKLPLPWWEGARGRGINRPTDVILSLFSPPP